MEDLDLNLNPYPCWDEGTDSQQEFANELVESFCERFTKYLYNGVHDNNITSIDAVLISNSIFMAIDSINDANWWCNKKSTNDFTIASKLLEDDEMQLELINKLKKEYN